MNNSELLNDTLILVNNTIILFVNNKPEHEKDFWDGMYTSTSFFVNGISVVLWLSWNVYIFFRTFTYECFVHSPNLPTKNQLRKMGLEDIGNSVCYESCNTIYKRCLRYFCCKLDDVFEEDDHTYFRHRPIRLFCCFHMASGILSLMLFFSSLFYEKMKNTDLCVVQGIVNQLSGFHVIVYLPIIFSWYFIEECSSKVEEKEGEKNSKEGVNINNGLSRLCEKEQRVRILNFLKCCGEGCTYFLVLFVAVITVFVAKFGGNQFLPVNEIPGKNYHGNWCWISDFHWQIGVFYSWLWISMGVSSIQLFCFFILLCFVYRCRDKKSIFFKLFWYLLVLYICWTPASIHRVYTGVTNTYEPFLGYLQGVSMSCYGAFNILLFYVSIFVRLLTRNEEMIKKKRSSIELNLGGNLYRN